MASFFLKIAEGLNSYSSIRSPQIIARCCQAGFEINRDIRWKKTHPTHYIQSRRMFFSNKKKEKINKTSPLAILDGKLSFKYRFNVKFVLCNMVDPFVQYHVNERFLLGAHEAFLYVTECLKNKSYRHLSEIVTPELLKRIENENGVHIRSVYATDYVQLKHFYLMTLSNIDWKIDAETKIK